MPRVRVGVVAAAAAAAVLYSLMFVSGRVYNIP